LNEDANPESYYFYVTEVAKIVYSNDAVSHVREQIKDVMVNFEDGKLRSALKVSNGPVVTQTIGTLYILSIFGRLFSFSTIALLSFIAAFTYPNLYAKYGNDIDKFFETTVITVSKAIKDGSASAIKAAPVLEKPLTFIGAYSGEKK